MLVSFWSFKGGVGVSVTAALFALHRARIPGDSALLVDLRGDQTLVLGTPDHDAEGLTDWLGLARRPPGSIASLGSDVAPGLRLIAPGRHGWNHDGDLDSLVAALASHPATVVVDAGVVLGADPLSRVAARLACESTRSILVTRACYLALARARERPTTPSGVVLLRERERALTPVDVESAVGAPVVAQIDVDPAIARAVDAGLLMTRTPRGLDRTLDAIT